MRSLILWTTASRSTWPSKTSTPPTCMCTGPRSAWMADRSEGESASAMPGASLPAAFCLGRDGVGGGGVAARGVGARPALAVERADQHLRDLRVELRAGVLAQLADGVAVVHRLAVGAVGGHRVVGVAGQDDPRADGDLLAADAVGV